MFDLDGSSAARFDLVLSKPALGLVPRAEGRAARTKPWFVKAHHGVGAYRRNGSSNVSRETFPSAPERGQHSLADAEPAEDLIQHVFHIHRTCQAAQRLRGAA